MSLPVPKGNKQLTDEDLALLATSPTWAQSPSEWFNRSGNDEETQAIQKEPGWRGERDEDPRGFLDDLDDGLPLSMELRGSDADNVDVVHAHYWDQLFTADERLRKTAMAQISRGLKNSLLNSNLAFEQSLPRLARLLSECPFKDVHQAIEDTMAALSKEMSVAGISMPTVPRPSRMFRESVIPITTDLEPQATLFKASFLNTGRVSHLFRIMAWHPSYLERFTESYDFLLRAEGPLPFSWRHYLAIISSARFKCDYLVKQQEQEFLLAGGDETWLETTKNCPPKLVRLLEVNALLAHQPWKLQPSHITELMKSADLSARWSAAELVQAFIILATFRALSGLAIGMGLNLEVDINVDISDQVQKSGSNPLLRLGKGLSESDESSNAERSDPNSQTEQLTSRLLASKSGDSPGDAEQRKQQFEAAGTDSVLSGPYYPQHSPTLSAQHSASPQPTASNGATGSTALPLTSTFPSFSASSDAQTSPTAAGRFAKYTDPYEVHHTDFDVRSKDYSVFHIQDWSWEEHAFELIERTYNTEFAQLLDLEFTTIFELTYHQVNGQTGVDTAPFRRSIWYYVHRIHGILHDDYNYATVNELLLRNLKKFTKDLSCTPFAVTAQDLLNLGYSLSPEEKCHIALLATEARKQAELMYALHALSKHLSSS